MSKSTPFEIPNSSEKLPYKFILDSIRERNLETESEEIAAVEAEPALVEVAVVVENVVEEVEAEPVTTAGLEIPRLSLPDGKKYFRIGEVSEIIGVEPYVLRYWEGEFSNIRPQKSGSGHRVYARKDVETLNVVRHLLHVEKFSIQGAKRRIQEMKKEAKSPQAGVSRQRHVEHLKSLAHELKALIAMAKANPGLT